LTNETGKQVATAKQDKLMSQDAHHDKSAYKVLLQPSGLEFESKPASSVLVSALHAHIRLPSSCRNGTCRTCLCILKSGNIRYQIEWPGLTREEKTEGYMLPCVAIAESDLVIEIADVISLK
jgi:ferredoxin